MQPQILETTIRDGSYEVGFQFTRHDVATLASLLDAAGFEFIEVGHGNGLGGEVFGAPGAVSDEEYLETARRAVTRAKLGALLGFSRRSDEYILDRVRAAAKGGLDYIRMGLVPRRSDDEVILKSVDLAKELGMTVSINFMRTYCAPPAEIEERSRRMVERGVDWVYTVDSAGGMTGVQIAEYIKAMGEAGASRVGYHGHNNTQQALANSLAAIEAGASLVDTSMQGLGRATGNAQTEVVLAMLQERFQSEQQIDRNLVFRLARRVIRPLLIAGFDPTDALSGALNVHSSSLPGLRAAAAENNLDVDDVLVDAGRKAGAAEALDTRDLPEAMITEACETLTKSRADSTVDLDAIARHCAAVAARPASETVELLAQLKTASLRDHLRAGLVIVPRRWSFDGPGLYCGQGWALGVLHETGPVPDDLPVKLEIERVFVAAELDPSGFEAIAPVQRFDYEALLAESAIVGCGLGRRTLVAIDDPTLREAIAGRVSSRGEITVLSPDAELEPSDSVELIVEGAFGSAVLEHHHLALSPASGVTVLGAVALEAATITALAKARCTVRTTNIFPLLLAQADATTQVNLARDADSPDHVALGSRLCDVSGGSIFGAWRPLSNREPDSQDDEFAVELERRRLQELIGLT